MAIRHALTAQRLGADIISMDGYECGGHPGLEEIGNFVLAPIAARKLKIPFIVSGGVSDGKQLAASLAMGAEGVNCGTRFIATKECTVKQGIKEALVKADERSTTHIMKTLKNTERVFKNDVTLQIQNIEKDKPGDIAAIYHLVKGENYKKSFHENWRSNH